MNIRTIWTAKKFEIVYSTALLFWYMFLALQIFFMTGQGVSSKYVYIYGYGCVVVGLLIFMSNIMRFFIPKYGKSPARYFAEIGVLAESSKERLLSNLGLVVRFGVLLMFGGAILVMGLSGQQVFPNPLETPFSQEQLETGQVSGLSNQYLNSVPVGFVEDGAAMFMSEIIIAFLSLGTWILVKIGVLKKDNLFLWIMRVLVAVFITALLFFSLAHKDVYGVNIGAYIVAFIFQFVNLLLFNVTGIFLPVGHIVNNWIFSAGFMVALSVGGATFSILPLFSTIKITKYKIMEVLKHATR